MHLFEVEHGRLHVTLVSGMRPSASASLGREPVFAATLNVTLLRQSYINTLTDLSMSE